LFSSVATATRSWPNRAAAGTLAAKLQLILIAGRSAKLEQALRAAPAACAATWSALLRKSPITCGWRIFHRQTGPREPERGDTLGLPCITVRNALTLPQERYNADWLTETATASC